MLKEFYTKLRSQPLIALDKSTYGVCCQIDRYID